MAYPDTHDGVFLSVSTVTSLLRRFHSDLCGSRCQLLVSRQPSGVAIGCSGCRLRVDDLTDELPALLRRRCLRLQQTLQLDAVAQERLLRVVLGQEPTAAHQKQRLDQTVAAAADQSPPRHQATAEKTKAVYKTARCEVCSKVFYKRSNLRVHMLKHLGVRPHWCQKCGKSFSDPSTYSRHVASVCGSQRHLTCHVCGKPFYHQVHLKEHLRKHTGEKPYSCQECGKSYACQGSLRRHLAGQCGAAACRFSCAICRKSFQWAEALARHVKLHAGVSGPAVSGHVTGVTLAGQPDPRIGGQTSGSHGTPAELRCPEAAADAARCGGVLGVKRHEVGAAEGHAAAAGVGGPEMVGMAGHEAVAGVRGTEMVMMAGHEAAAGVKGPEMVGMAGHETAAGVRGPEMVGMAGHETAAGVRGPEMVGMARHETAAGVRACDASVGLSGPDTVAAARQHESAGARGPVGRAGPMAAPPSEVGRRGGLGPPELTGHYGSGVLVPRARATQHLAAISAATSAVTSTVTSTVAGSLAVSHVGARMSLAAAAVPGVPLLPAVRLAQVRPDMFGLCP